MRVRRVIRFMLAGVAIAAVSLLAACSKSSSPTSPGGGGNAPAPFNLGPFALGQSAKLVFPNAGTFGYHCTPHRTSGMTGTVTVSASATLDSVVVDIGTGNVLAFTPSSVTIRPAGYVRWVNQSSMTNHTVTSN